MATVVILDRLGQLDLEDYRRIAFDNEPLAVGSQLLAAVDADATRCSRTWTAAEPPTASTRAWVT
jgi:hypothetical protein